MPEMDPVTSKWPAPGTLALASYLQCRAALFRGASQAESQVMPWALASYIAGAEPEPNLITTLRADLGLFRFYRELLRVNAQGVSPRQAAAASDVGSAERAGYGFRLEFRDSRAESAQVYVTIVLDGVEPTERGLQVHVLAEDALLRLDFPLPVDGRSQRLFPAESLELGMLRRMDAELMLVTL